MARMSEWDTELADLNARYEKAVKEAGWSPGSDGGVKVVRPPGRPREGARRVAVTVSLSPQAVEILDKLFERYHTPRGRILDRLLEGMRQSPSEEPEPEPKRKRR